MLLRRVTKHVRNQNWFAVALDFVIVVVGVFIGIQVANWNEAQADRRLGRYYLDRLVVDLTDDLEMSTQTVAYYKQVLESVKRTETLLLQENPDEKAIVAAAYRATEASGAAVTSATWDQIVSSGHIGLLRDSSLENSLANYYRVQQVTIDSNAQLFNSPYRQAVRSLIPLSVQLAIREGCSDALDTYNQPISFVEDCVIKVDVDVLERTANVIRTSQAVRESLRNQYSTIITVLAAMEGNAVQITDLLNSIRGKLGA
ncbi:conserved hypothetical protein [gamma proteobacterium NOR5-3]|nr:conserved hypothetical protein [gamma proteobacterium NOR5-3]